MTTQQDLIASDLLAAKVPILREAGGHFSTWAGDITIWGKDAMACNAALRDQVLAVLDGG